MNNILSEKQYQSYIIDRLKENGYEVWPQERYDRLYAVDRQELFRFLNATKPEVMKTLNKIYKDKTELGDIIFETKIIQKIVDGLSVMDKEADIQYETKGINLGDIIYDKESKKIEISKGFASLFGGI